MLRFWASLMTTIMMNDLVSRVRCITLALDQLSYNGFYTQEIYNNHNSCIFPYSGIQTVRENIKGFTDRQVQQVNKAQAAYNMEGAPGIKASPMMTLAVNYTNAYVIIRQEDKMFLVGTNKGKLHAYKQKISFNKG